MHGLAEVANIGRRDASNTGTTVARHVDVELVLQTIDLLGCQASEGEHADLVGDVRPIASRTGLLQALHQLVAHRNDAISHQLDLRQPTAHERIDHVVSTQTDTKQRLDRIP
jgi:hypothetical protein